MKWNLRMVAAQRDIWRPTELLAAFRAVGFSPSLSKTSALWGGNPVTVRLDDLDMICAALECTVEDLMRAEPVATHVESSEGEVAQAAGEVPSPRSGPVRPLPRRDGPRRLMPPN
ncbi:XRE family transcriptional regulator [Streptomyces lunaelactis]|uniref:XRE family transcriptional regulator n=1 Tax=Streptomyces lunaelactis TaxID=1535768 RepID=A0A2R4TDA7_9ACTN|nr:helix-turn-helix transcriptional regulator [Streptomyces lunaelactis]AVZ77093.1 XRE family transcriptional regulator [Streptomyces lunaelactis]NUK12951.1 helix-turn-helix transcriptional regulator [Streptomyces lunaelactis]NUK25389.1 helix-turn-helix transcriptional regulator [Streptomyces lunaelactis]NUK36374.1 helix-turn-helix transcriptional regulator [Streptomyces lunaelactis]NUK42877.1 helix-turn-helix transcriptional regulator [Streptomyces lunaelactis]